MLILILIFVLAILAKDLFDLYKEYWVKKPDFQLPTAEEVTLFVRRGDKWLFHSKRPVGHPDIDEVLRTPGMAILQNGKVTEGRAEEKNG